MSKPKKRLTDADKWRDPWFRRLPKDLKLLWLYILDNCDMAGCWDEDLEFASLLIGFKYHIDRVLNAFNNGKPRVSVFDGGRKWMIEDFASFQYGELTSESRVHKGVMALLCSYKAIGYAKGINTPKDKDKDIILEKLEKPFKFQPPELEQVKEYFREKSCPEKADEFYDHFKTRNWVPKGYTKQMVDWRAAARNWMRPKNFQKQGSLHEQSRPNKMRGLPSA